MSFKLWLEEKEEKTYKLKAVMDLASALQDIFKKYSKPTREKAWEKITSKAGKEKVDQLLRTPTKNISIFRTLIP